MARTEKAELAAQGRVSNKDQIYRCYGCKQETNHPHVHILYGLNVEKQMLDWAHMHHDCIPETPWHAHYMQDDSEEGDKVRHFMKVAASGIRGEELDAYITKIRKNGLPEQHRNTAVKADH